MIVLDAPASSGAETRSALDVQSDLDNSVDSSAQTIEQRGGAAAPVTAQRESHEAATTARCGMTD